MKARKECCRNNPVEKNWTDINDTEITIDNDDLTVDNISLNFNISNTQAGLKIDQPFQVNAAGIVLL